MKKILALLIITTLFVIGCNSEKSGDAASNENLPEGTHRVSVKEKIEASDYFYLLVNEDDKDYWIAVPKIPVNKGDNITYSKFMEMKNFESKTLNRKFESVLFVEDAATEQTQGNKIDKSNPHPKVSDIPNLGVRVEPLKGGKTIAEIIKNKEQLSGKTVKIRGVVSKFNEGIMDRNWIHIQDGTNNNGEYDLLITSNDKASMGKTIVAEGKITVNKDFGAGYSYSVLIENARIIEEISN